MKKTIVFLFALMFLYSCTPQDAPNTFKDKRDGKVYKTVTIGDQVWMAENLAYLPSVVGQGTGSEDEGHTSDPYYYVFGFDGTNVTAAKATTNYTKYGVLYNWTAALSACPDGWHLPSDVEWTQLTDYLAGESVAAGKMKEAGTNHWSSPNTGATNESGFTALPGGCRYDGGAFGLIGRYGDWWSSTEYNTNGAWERDLYYNTTIVATFGFPKDYGLSVRCLRD